MDYRAIRTGRYKYIHWIQHPDENELYDLREDPYETRNLIADPGMQPIRDELREKLGSAVLHAAGLSSKPEG